MLCVLLAGSCSGRSDDSHSLSVSDTIKVPVTYYDFRSDRSNPEFEQDHSGGLRPAMVAQQADSAGLPRLGPAPYLNYGIANWFRPWIEGDSTCVRYHHTGGVAPLWAEMEYGGIEHCGHDTSFINRVIPDTLRFIPDPANRGVMEFRCSEEGFFPLDGRGFGNEGLAHNYSFTLHMRRDFVYEKGLWLEAVGDDDFWVFINGQLALDCGGVHGSIGMVLELDTLQSLAVLGQGSTCQLDLFYCERHSPNSWLSIRTNFFK